MSLQVARTAGRRSVRPLSTGSFSGNAGRRSVPCVPRSHSPSPDATSMACRRRGSLRAVSASTSRPSP
eukprot:835659-Pleurochrysis_carterae.AAC.1